MHDARTGTLTAEQADRVAERCEAEINRSDWHDSRYDRDMLADLRKKRDEAREHAQAIRDQEQGEAESKQAQQQADDEARVANAEPQMAMLRDEVEAGRASADRLKALLDDLHRAKTAEMALEHLRTIEKRSADAAERLGTKAPQAPHVEPLPQIRQVQRVLPTPERADREESERLQRQIAEAGQQANQKAKAKG